MLNATKLACAIALPLLINGCQSSLLRIQPVAVQCQPVLIPAAWSNARPV
ncbi:hypothetical protein PS861_00158 [Pseudomonas fluorescens]|nr:hypothetical protein PS861_00158 [Pseudomonas fluorescens]